MSETKERVRVQAGRGGGPKPAQVPALRDERAAPAKPRSQEPRSMLAIIAEAAANPDVNVEKMESLLKMQREIEDREAVKAFNRAFLALQEDLPNVNRDGKIEVRKKDDRGDRTGAVQQSTPYATFNNIMKVCKPIMRRHGFGLSFSTEPTADGRINVKGYLIHDGGHQRETSFPLPAETSGSKNNVQGWGSSLSYGKRYATIALLNVISEAKEDADVDGNEGRFKPARAKEGGEVFVEERVVEVVSDEQAAKLREAIEWCGVPLTAVLKHFGVDKLSALPATLYETAMQDCRDYRANQDRKREDAARAQGGFRR